MMANIVLMADIIGSSKRAGKELMMQFKQLTDSVKRKHTKRFLSPITITLGDEFQSVVKSVEDAMAVVVELEEKIIELNFEFKLRYSIYEGEIDTPINKEVAYGMLGEALTKARATLDDMKSKKYERFFISLIDKKQAEIIQNYFLLYISFIDAWKASDYPLVYAFIDKDNYREVAKIFDKDDSQMWKRNKSLHIREYLAIRNLILKHKV